MRPRCCWPSRIAQVRARDHAAPGGARIVPAATCVSGDRGAAALSGQRALPSPRAPSRMTPVTRSKAEYDPRCLRGHLAAVSPRRMSQPLTLHPERLFPADPATRAIARALYAGVAELPIISPHGHTDPAWFATDAPFANPTELLLAPDHYVFRMLYSQGLDLDALGVPSRAVPRRPIRAPPGACSRSTTTCSAARRRVSGSTMSSRRCSASTCGSTPRPRTTTTTPSTRRWRRRTSGRARCSSASASRCSPPPKAPTRSARAPRRDPRQRLAGPRHHRLSPRSRGRSRASNGSAVDAGALRRADRRGRRELDRLSRRASQAPRLLRRRMARPRPTTAIPARPPPISRRPKPRRLFARVAQRRRHAGRGRAVPRADADRDGAHEPRRRPGACRSIPARCATTTRGCSRTTAATRAPTSRRATDYVRALKPLLDRFGNERALSIIVFTLDETAYSRELAPLAGHYPALKLGPGLVVPRQPRRHAPLPRADHRDAPASTTPSASTTTPAPSSRSRRATMSRAASTAPSSRAWWPSTGWPRTRRREVARGPRLSPAEARLQALSRTP